MLCFVGNIGIIADAVGVLLIENRRPAVVDLVEEQGPALDGVVDPVHAHEVGFRVLVAVFQAYFGFHRFRRHKGLGQGNAVGVGMALDVQIFQRPVRNVDAVGAVVEAQLRPIAVDGKGVGQAEGFRTFGKDRGHHEGIADSRQAPILPEHAAAVQAARLAAGVVGKEAEDLLLRLVGRNDVVRRAVGLAGFHGDAQLSVVRRVEPQKILIDIGNISYLPFFNSDAVSNVIYPRRVVPLYRYGAGLAFDDANMDAAALNGLRG